jgi:hypothetical protein
VRRRGGLCRGKEISLYADEDRDESREDD